MTPNEAMPRAADRAEDRFDPYRHYLAGKGQPRTMRALPGLARSALELARRAGSAVLVVVVISQLLTAVLLGLQVLFGKAVIQEVLEQSGGGGSFNATLAPLFGLAGVTAAAGLLSGAQTHLQRLLGERVQQLSMRNIVTATTSVGLIDFESPQFFDDLQRVRLNALMRPLTLVTGLVQVIGGAVAVAGLTATMFVIEPLLLPILFVGAVPLSWLSRRSGKAEFAFAVRQAAQRRRRGGLGARAIARVRILRSDQSCRAGSRGGRNSRGFAQGATLAAELHGDEALRVRRNRRSCRTCGP